MRVHSQYFSDQIAALPRPESWMPGPPPPWASREPGDRTVTTEMVSRYIDMQQRQLHQLQELDIDDSQATEMPESALEELGDNDLATKPAAVLVPFVESQDGSYLESIVVMTRTMEVSHHKGQISFPGGMVEADDIDNTHTALRETEEEIGIDPEAFTVLGTLTDVTTRARSGSITPIVATCKPEVLNDVVTSEAEVEELHTIALSELLKPDAYINEIWDFGMMSATIHMYFVTDTVGREVFIWGATAHILTDVLHCLSEH